MKNLVTLFIALTLFITNIFAAETGELRGKIIDTKTKKPLDYATLVLLKDGKIVAQILSDDDGEYLIKLLLPGKYTLKADYIGYDKKVIEDVEIMRETVTYQNINMMSGRMPNTIVCRTYCCFGGQRVIRNLSAALDSIREVEAWTKAKQNYAEERNLGFACQLEHKSRAIEDKLKQKGVRLINQVVVFPNPTSNILHVESMFDGRKRLRILNMAGIQVYSTDITHHAELNVSSMTEGIYIIEVIDEFTQEKITERIIVQH